MTSDAIKLTKEQLWPAVARAFGYCLFLRADGKSTYVWRTCQRHLFHDGDAPCPPNAIKRTIDDLEKEGGALSEISSHAFRQLLDAYKAWEEA
jgi:hypothetical protein